MSELDEVLKDIQAKCDAIILAIDVVKAELLAIELTGGDDD